MAHRRRSRTSRSPEVHRLMVAAGFEQIIERALQQDVPGIKVLEVASGAVVVRGQGIGGKLSRLPYLSVVLQQVARVEAPDLDAAMLPLADRLQARSVPDALLRSSVFRLRTSDGGALVRVDSKRRRRLEQAIARWSSLRPEPRGGGAEIWLMRRRGDAHVALAVRIDTPPQQKPAKGELKPDLAAALVRTTDIGADDVFLDPFAGRGALLKARARWAHRLLAGSDTDPEAALALEHLNRSGALGTARTAKADARDPHALAALLDGQAFDVMVTDPPWGLFTEAYDLDGLYRDAMAAVREVAVPGARVVLLTAAGNQARGALGHAGFDVGSSFPVLVNGKKAEVIIGIAHNT